MYKNLAGRAVLAWVTACFLSPAFSQTAPPKPPMAKDALKVGFVYVTPVTDAGWVRQHEEGRKAVEAALGPRVNTVFVENVPEGADAERVIRDLAQQGSQLIFTPSFGYMEPTLKVAKDFPGVKFESITGYKTAPNVATANARYYEGRYLAGIAAGRMTKTNVAGYVAGFPIPEVLQGINAFTLGMRSVNPKAKVIVVWLNEWFDPPKERDAAMALFNQNADVLAFHTGSTAVMAAAQERGKMAVAYHSDMRRSRPTRRSSRSRTSGRLLHATREGRARRHLEERQPLGRREGRNDPRRRLRHEGAQGRAGRGAGAAEGHRGRQAAAVPRGGGRCARQRRPRRDRQGRAAERRTDPADELAGRGRAGAGDALSVAFCPV